MSARIVCECGIDCGPDLTAELAALREREAYCHEITHTVIPPDCRDCGKKLSPGVMALLKEHAARIAAENVRDQWQEEVQVHRKDLKREKDAHELTRVKLDNLLKWQERAIAALTPFADAHLDPSTATHRITLHDLRMAFEARGVPFVEKKHFCTCGVGHATVAECSEAQRNASCPGISECEGPQP